MSIRPHDLCNCDNEVNEELIQHIDWYYPSDHYAEQYKIPIDTKICVGCDGIINEKS